MAQLDWGVGRVMETLEELGLTENTLIIFSSDNGPVLFDGYFDGAWEKNGDHQAAGPWRGGKYSVWEGGTRMPTIVSWPGTVQPGLSDAIVSQVDFLASIASLTGASIPRGRATDSQDQLDALLGRTDEGRAHVVQQGVGAWSIRAGDWKYIPPGRVRDRFRIGTNTFEPIPETGALFFLPEDPEERNNLATCYPEKTAELKALLDAELK